MRYKLLALLLLLWAGQALAQSDVPTLTAATSLTGSTTYLAQGGSLNRKLAFNTTMFGVSANALILNTTTLGSTALTIGGTTSTITGLTLTSPTINSGTLAGGALSGTFSGTPTFSGSLIFSGAAPQFTALSGGTQATCLGLTAGNVLVTSAGSCSTGGGGGGSGVGVQAGQAPTGIGNDTTALTAGKYFYYTNAAMTAPRTHNLMDNATQGAGNFQVCDTLQTVTSTNKLTLAAPGSNTLNGVTNGTAIIYTAGGCAEFHSDGAGAFTTVINNTTPSLNSGQIYVGNASNQPAASTPGTGVITAVGVNLSANGGLTTTIASGAKALATGAIGSAACTAAQTDTATNTLTTDVVLASFNGDPTGVTGYVPLVAGMLTIISYPTADTVNFKVCNNSNASITPGAITLNWRVVR